MDEYTYKTPELCEFIGISRWTLIKWEKQGRFTPPRGINGHRIFTMNQMKEIKRAFSPHGDYQWYFQSGK